MLQLTMRQCRDAAEAVRRAEHGPAAVRRLRGDRLAGFFRQRPGLAVLLYLAALQGLVVWRPLAGFALLGPPGGCSDCVEPGRRARLARRTEAVWPYLCGFSPAILLLAAMPFALLAGRYALLLASLAALLVMLYVMALLVPMVLRGHLWIIRWFRGAPRGSRAPLDLVLDSNWSVGLCHLEDLDMADELLRECIERAELLSSGTRYAGGALVCPDAAVTTGRARAAVAAATLVAEVSDLDEPMVLVRKPGSRLSAPEPVPVQALGLFFVTSLVVLAGQASVIVDQGPPASYLDVLAWLLDQAWLVGDLGTTAPAWRGARLYGATAQLLGLTAIFVVATTGWRAYRSHRAADDAGAQSVDGAIARADSGLVFLNYRKGEHRRLVTVLRRELASRLGEEKTFMDYWSMAPGARYPDELRAGVLRCRVLLAIIHDGWLDDLRAQPAGQDWVHDEIAMALELGRTVIPVYFDDARQLEAAELPADIRELALRQSCRIRWEAADADLDRLQDVVIAAASARR